MKALIALAVLALVYFGPPALLTGWQYATSSKQEVQVVNTWVKDNKYMANVVLPSGKTENIQVQDNSWWITWNASDRWALLKKNEGKKVTARIVGLRSEWMSWFPNPVSICDPTECK